MGNLKTTNQKELMNRFAVLRIEKSNREVQPRQTYNDLIATFNFISLIKSIATPRKNSSLSFAKIAFNYSIDLIIAFVLGKSRTIKRSLNEFRTEGIPLLLISNNYFKSNFENKQFL